MDGSIETGTHLSLSRFRIWPLLLAHNDQEKGEKEDKKERQYRGLAALSVQRIGEVPLRWLLLMPIHLRCSGDVVISAWPPLSHSPRKEKHAHNAGPGETSPWRHLCHPVSDPRLATRTHAALGSTSSSWSRRRAQLTAFPSRPRRRHPPVRLADAHSSSRGTHMRYTSILPPSLPFIAI